MIRYEDRVKMLSNLLSEEELQPLVNYMIDNGFLTAPASTKYHGAYEGGLFDHSFQVATQLINLTLTQSLQWQKSRSPKLVGIAHDLCKIDAYVCTKGEGRQQFTYNPHITDRRHGEKSVDIIKKIVPDLTEEEELCIKFHMGFTIPKTEWDGYRDAIKKYNNVLWTHQADMIASVIHDI